MATVGEQDSGGHGRAARLAWRAEILSLAAQYLALKPPEQKRSRKSRYNAHDERGRDFDLALIAASGLFDAAYYVARNEDVARAAIPPLHHYLLHGGVEGRQPGPAFDAALYLARYADLSAAGINPVVHYLKFGILEERTAGAPDRHPAPVALDEVLKQIGGEPVSGAFEFPTSPPGQDGYAAAMALKAEIEQRDASLHALEQAFERRAEALQADLLAREADLAASQAREAEYRAEVAELRAAHEGVELQLAVANASFQRVAARNDDLLGQQQACVAEMEGLRRERDAAADALRQAGQAFETEKADLALQVYVANASLRRATARNDELLRSHQGPRQEEEDLRAEFERRDAEARRIEEELATMRAAAAAGRTELETARSELATTASELAITARELIITGRELRRLQDQEKDHLSTRAERDALRLHVATLENGLQREREQEAASIASRAGAAALVNDVRAGLDGQLERIARDITILRRDLEVQPAAGSLAARTLYLDLLEAALAGTLTRDETVTAYGGDASDPERRAIDRAWPRTAVTMSGADRLRHLRQMLEEALDDGIDGDILEAGAWRGGACIYMRGILAARRVRDRRVWVADSFAGPPAPDTDRYLADRGDAHHTVPELAVSLDAVREHFERFGLLDKQVAFLPGWFKDSLASAPIQQLAVLRLDGGMYGSTLETLEALYAKVSPGGFIIVADYALKACRAAIDDYRAQYKICEPIIEVDRMDAYWRKAK